MLMKRLLYLLLSFYNVTFNTVDHVETASYMASCDVMEHGCKNVNRYLHFYFNLSYFFNELIAKVY